MAGSAPESNGDLHNGYQRKWVSYVCGLLFDFEFYRSPLCFWFILWSNKQTVDVCVICFSLWFVLRLQIRLHSRAWTHHFALFCTVVVHLFDGYGICFAINGMDLEQYSWILQWFYHAFVSFWGEMDLLENLWFVDQCLGLWGNETQQQPREMRCECYSAELFNFKFSTDV